MSFQIPFFPLPDVVLFPRTVLSLHVFEPRYRSMMDYVMRQEHKVFAVAHLRDGYEEDYFGAPPVFKMMTPARLLFVDQLKDGRWNILLEGITRAQLLEEVQVEPFRIGRMEQVIDEVDPDRRPETEALMFKLAEFAERAAAMAPTEIRNLRNLVNVHQHPSIVCDVVAAQLVTDPYARQSILEERDIIRRLRLTSIQVQHLIDDLERKETGSDMTSKD
ncbi:LON peptidase substrate-binding domain-containing protein [Candidatus Sumerlaeota bacterium]|nr:LON peptidase substrate-binding domain-containing protein [Candidatus Sumerlaeota bacterium]